MLERICKKCGVTKPLSEFKKTRNTFEYRCIECHRLYCKEWWSKSKDHIKAYKEENRERDRIRRKEWYDRNIDYVRRSTREWRLKNIEHRAAYMKEQQQMKPEVFARNAAMRRANQKNATPKWANKFFISEAYDLAKRRSLLLGFKWHVDHIVPLQSKIVCGFHVEDNIQVIPASKNQAKNNRSWPDMP